MGKSCTIRPRVKNKNGQVVESKLFKSLLDYTGDYAETRRVYLITKNPEFAKKFHPRMELDDNGEPTIGSMLKHTNLSTIVPDDKILNKLNRKIGYYKKGESTIAEHPYTEESYKQLKEKAIDFNNTSEYKDRFVAKVIPQGDSTKSSYVIKVVKRNTEESIIADKMEYNESLNARLKEILASHGISIGALTETEKRMRINGVSDFDIAKNTANGLVELIRLAEGERGEQALPEEFAHTAIEMMGDNPLVNRLINHLHSNNLVGEILGDDYETYSIQYKEDSYKLAKEAAGKLLAKHLLQEQAIPAKPYKNILERVIEAVKNFFRSISASSIQKAIHEADREFSQLAGNILNGSMDNQMSINNITSSELYYQVSESVQRDKKLLKSIIDNELKRLKIYEERSNDGNFDASQRALIDKLNISYLNNKEIQGIYDFLEEALKIVQQVQTKLNTLSTTPGMTLKEKASLLRDIRNYLYSYKNIMNDIRESLIEDLKTDNRYGEKIKTLLDNTTTIINYSLIDYSNLAKPLFLDFITPFFGNNLVVPFGKNKGKVIKAEDLLMEAENDISFFDCWLNSMADSPDFMLKAIDKAVKKSKDNARLRTIKLRKKIEAAGIKLAQAGIKNTAWMFEVDENGNYTGNYIDEIDYRLYYKKKKEMLKSLEDKYGKNPIGEKAKYFKAERDAWYNANLETVNGIKRPIYKNVQYQNLNTAQKEFHKTMMDIKKELDGYLPPKYTHLHNTIKIRKDLLERVKSSESIRSGAKQLWEGVKEDFIRRSDDNDFSDKATLKDFENNEVQSLPIYFTKLKNGESENDISTDVVSTMIAYASMAHDFDEMNKIIDFLEVGRDIMRGGEGLSGREHQNTRSGKGLVEKINIMGQETESKLTTQGNSTKFMTRMNNYFSMQVYGRYMADEGTFGKSNIDRGKTANFINKITSLTNLAVSLLTGISNVATGKVMMRTEAFSGEYFNESNVLRADRTYGQYIMPFLGEIGSKIKTNKLALWNELFNVMQEYEEDVRDSKFRKSWFGRMFNENTLYFISNAGEHWMQTRTSLALADRYKMKSPEGKIVNLWDAMEVVYTDPSNPNLGATLQLKKGYTKEDGSAFTQDDITAFSRKSAGINERMHGIYNKLDRSAIQKMGLGRMAIMFRKWMVPSVNRRWQQLTYNQDLENWTEGYYRTTFRFLGQVLSDLKSARFTLFTKFKELSGREKANIWRAVTETAHFFILAAILSLVNWHGDDDDDKERPWISRMTEYQARRLYTEIGSMIPGLPMVNEGLKILKSPAAGINTIENTMNLVKILNPGNWGDELQSGRFEGHSTAYKALFESSLIPMNKTIYRNIHPEESIPFYKQ